MGIENDFSLGEYGLTRKDLNAEGKVMLMAP